MSSIDQNKQLVAELFDAFRAGDTSRFDALIAADYRQHNPQAVDGLETVKALFNQLGPIDVDVHRVIAEGDLVVVHSHYKSLNMAGVDIFKVGAGGKIVEHWDVLQPIPETTASGNDMFSELS
jgi:predicted SnoaL-like aldol condensation-catalyzing enzyme